MPTPVHRTGYLDAFDHRFDVLSPQPSGSGETACSPPLERRERACWLPGPRTGGYIGPHPPALQLSAGQQLSSVGPAGGEGQFVLITTSSGAAQLDVVDGPGASWHQLVSPPAGTATVAFGPARASGPPTPQALATTTTVLTVWTLDQASNAWVKSQAIDVPIEFGSSS
jgi:hypothetical protein